MVVGDKRLAVLAALGSVALLGGAMVFQYGFGMAPCELCLWQRWPHLVAAALGLVVWLLPAWGLVLLGAGAAATSGGIGIYHTGVERGWWPGPSACSGAIDPTRLSAEDLLDLILAAPVVRCDQVPWELAGLSMASWNALLSLALAGLWLLALRRPVR